MSKYPGPFWHEKYMLFDALIIILIPLLLSLFIVNLIHRYPGFKTLIWIIGILIFVVIIGFRFWLIWFFEIRKNKKS
jgi:positive regulator of sigma E activity